MKNRWKLGSLIVTTRIMLIITERMGILPMMKRKRMKRRERMMMLTQMRILKAKCSLTLRLSTLVAALDNSVAHSNKTTNLTTGASELTPLSASTTNTNSLSTRPKMTKTSKMSMTMLPPQNPVRPRIMVAMVIVKN